MISAATGSQTFLRRVGRRMAMTGSATLDAYIAKLEAEPKEITLLFRDLLIRVTSFFRDQETFRILAAQGGAAAVRGEDGGRHRPGLGARMRNWRRSLFPRHPDAGAHGHPDRAAEGADIRHGHRRLGHCHGPAGPLSQDAGRRSVGRAAAAGSSPGRRAATASRKEIRDLCTFSVHNLVRDPPFSMMSLVSCRNLLIYMSTPIAGARSAGISLFAAAGGILLLGGSESVAQHCQPVRHHRQGRAHLPASRWPHAGDRPAVESDETRCPAQRDGAGGIQVNAGPRVRTPLPHMPHRCIRAPASRGNREPNDADRTSAG